MRMLLFKFKYAVDTCSFTQLKRFYPVDVFHSVWEKVEDMSRNRLICSVEDVYIEIMHEEDEVAEWAKKRRHIFLSLDEEIQLKTKKILQSHPNLLDLKKNKSGADPWLIALAMVQGCTVVTEEKPSAGPDRSKIPDVCKVYGIECIKLIDMFRREGLRL
jgi:hypothetical protein